MIAESYERIHRSNLVGMGIVPLQYQEGQTADTLGLTGTELFSVNIPQDLKPGQDLAVQVRKSSGSSCDVVIERNGLKVYLKKISCVK